MLYDGNAEEPLNRIMKLSDAFGGDPSSLELIVQSYNINYGLDQPLLKKCKYLNNYSTLVGKIKIGIAEGLTLGEAMIRAINFCIANDIMKDYLLDKGKEVFNMLRMEWNIEDALEAWKEEGIEKGIEQGIEQGKIENSEEIAIKMIQKGISFETIQELTELPLKRIEELANLIKN